MVDFRGVAPSKELGMSRSNLELLLLIFCLNRMICLSHGHLCIQKSLQLQNYSVLELPGHPTVLNIEFNLFNLMDINEASQTFSLRMWLSMSWIDPRLSGQYPLKGNCTKVAVKLNEDTSGNIWLPDITFVRSTADLNKQLYDKNILYMGDNGKATLEFQIYATFGCPMDFTGTD